MPPKLAAKGDNSLVLVGNYANGRIQPSAEIISLWCVAYLEDLFPPSTKALISDFNAMNRDIAHIDAFRRKRYLNVALYRLSLMISCWVTWASGLIARECIRLVVGEDGLG